MTNLDSPQYSAAEKFVDGCVHFVGIGAAIAGVVALFIVAIGSVSAVSIASLVIYSLGLVSVLSFSAAYNLVGISPLKGFLRRFDHASIYLKIACTYTPFLLVKLHGWEGPGLLSAIWAVALFGITAKLLFPGHLKRTSYVLYLALGWCAVLIFPPLLTSLSHETLLLLAAGGVFYTVGVIFHLWEKLRYQNAIWHVFVLLGAGCHYAAVMTTIALT
jgi:hemolysin III